MTALSTAGGQDACAVLSLAGLIRLIAEIDDNGPIPKRGLARTLPDLSLHRLRHATDLARTLHLVHGGAGGSLVLTASGEELADAYDALARWARRHNYPAPICDFTRRIQHTLALLATPATPRVERDAHAPAAPGEQALADLAGPRDALEQWLRAHPQVGQLPAAA
ncbi:hypothetical protein ACFC0M_06000 [Streptomyces sp. NPDC056149]|uniref:hypothetical protein n=1 Tax=Streptomyces sp. NPDC056149 TaxID=3345728 RepID=UPI0035D58531